MDLTYPGKMARETMRKLRWREVLLIPASLIVFVVLWELIYRLANLPAFVLPGPALVWGRFLQAAQDGSLWRHSLVTLSEVIAGLLIGSAFAASLGYLLAKSPVVERWIAPYIVASQAIPIVAIAPSLIIWVGPGWGSKALICALVVFFPILVNTALGLKSVPEDFYELMHSLKATRLQIFRWLEVPAALPVLLGGLRIGATLSAIGAVVGEFVGSKSGLGFLINVARGQYDTSMVFVAVFTLIAMALLLYSLVVLLENRLLIWQQRPELKPKS